MEKRSNETFLFEFHAEKDSQVNCFVTPIIELVDKYFGQTKEVYRRNNDELKLVILELCQSSLATIRVNCSGLILINLDISSDEDTIFTFEIAKQFENELQQKLGNAKSKCICPIQRGGKLDMYRYLTSSDDRLLEYDVDHVVVDTRSRFQKIQILHTISFGNLLVLDDLQNLAESDLIYTETLMQRGKIDYSDKEILILGAGDGALLWELLKENPKMITMVEIDETVIQLCRQHLRTACGSALDSYTGPHHRIIIGDCIEELDGYVARQEKFDYIFADLTDIPLCSEPQNKEWQLLQNVLEKSLQILRSTGRFLTHGSGISSEKSLALFEDYLKRMEIPVKYERCQAFVPSFMEEWVFYQVWKSTEEE